MAEQGPQTAITIEDPGTEAFGLLVQRLGGENPQVSPWDRRTFSAVLRGDDGALLGGAHAILNMGLVEIRGLWIAPALRGRGLGLRLMETIEREARARGMTRAALDTYDWQARGFYEKLGYRVFGSLDYPAGAQRFYMVKELTPPG